MEAVLEAVKRTTTGKNENNRTRAAGQIPAVVYGAQKAGDAVAPVSVAVDPKPFMRILHSKSGLNTLITLKVPGETDARVLVKEVQLDPITQPPAARGLLPRQHGPPHPRHGAGGAQGRAARREGGRRRARLPAPRDRDRVSADARFRTRSRWTSAAQPERRRSHLRDVAEDVTWTVGDRRSTRCWLHVVTLKVVEEPAPGAERRRRRSRRRPAEPEVIKKGKTDKDDEKADKGEKKK